MNDSGDQRRLSAILAADVVGYTQRMEQDTDGTVAAWKAARSNVIDPTISDHSGRIVKHTGDGFLAEFSTGQNAVKCAINLQEKLVNNPLEFRIGINLGDIVDDGVDIHGEGVNIAARIEGLAKPGGICISGSVYELVRNQVAASFEDIGEQEVKHVSALVRVYRVALESQPTKTQQNSRSVASGETGKRLDEDLRLSGILMLFLAPGMVLLGLFVGAFLPMLGVSALIGCIGAGLLVASNAIGRRYREDDSSPPN
jgi:class 3 adenylate cyclase